MSESQEDGDDPAAPAAKMQRKTRGRPFPPGQSGNPAGSSPGRRHRALEALDLIGEENAQAVLRRVVQDALAGDVRCSDILLRRVWPERKGKPIHIELPEMNTAGDLVQAMTKVTNAVATGQISPEEGQAMAAVLDIQRRTIETRDLEARMRRIEEQQRGAA